MRAAQRELVDEGLEVIDHLGSRFGAALELIGTVLVELRGSHVERQRHVFSGGVAGSSYGFREELESSPVGGKIRRESPFIPDVRREFAFGQDLLEGVVDLDTHPQRIGKTRRSGRHQHELLDVDRVGRVGAAVEHIQHGDRKDPRRRPTQVLEERDAELAGRGTRHAQGHGQDGVGAQVGFVGSAVQVEHHLIDELLVGGIDTDQCRCENLVDIGNGPRYALSAEAVSTISKLHGFERPCRRTAGNRRPTKATASKTDFSLHGGVPTAVEDFTGPDFADVRGHGPSLWVKIYHGSPFLQGPHGVRVSTFVFFGAFPAPLQFVERHPGDLAAGLHCPKPSLEFAGRSSQRHLRVGVEMPSQVHH